MSMSPRPLGSIAGCEYFGDYGEHPGEWDVCYHQKPLNCWLLPTALLPNLGQLDGDPKQQVGASSVSINRNTSIGKSI